MDVQILVDGKPVKQHWFDSKHWVEARKGKNYEIKIKNSTGHRVLAVVSVDGLDVLTGRAADSNSGGYIIDGYGSYTIKGFRISDDEVNLFEFSDKGQSYAAKSPTGEQSTANCGIIGVRFIEEKRKPIVTLRRNSLAPDNGDEPWNNPKRWPSPEPWRPRPNYPIMGDVPQTDWMEQERSATVREPVMKMMSLSFCDESPMRSAQTKGFDMGTKFSETKVADKVTKVEFERGTFLSEVSVYYASRSSLEEMGIKFEPEPKVSVPKAFKDSGYCQPPK